MLKLTLTGPIFHFHKVSLLSEVLRTRQQAGNISTDNCFMKINGLKTGINIIGESSFSMGNCEHNIEEKHRVKT